MPIEQKDLDPIHAKLDKMQKVLDAVLGHLDPPVVELPPLHPAKKGTADYENYLRSLRSLKKGDKGYAEAQAELREFQL